MGEHARRIEALQQALTANGCIGAVVAATDQMRYLVGWAEPPGERMLALAVPAIGSPSLLVPALYEDDARARVHGVPVASWHDSVGWTGEMAAMLDGWTKGVVAIDDELAAGHLLSLQAMLPGTSWKPLGWLMATLRGVKSADEIARMERSAQVADSVFETIVTEFRPGVSEREVQSRIMDEFSRRAASSAWAIVCFGPNTALPHHHSGDRRLQAGDMVILDLGCCFDGYQSDITRTGCYGRPTDEAREVYAIVHEAHMAVMAAARPGVTCESVDAAAREVIRRHGYGDRFIHRTGHGIGLSTHEPPNLVEGDMTEIRPGMCFSNEPGIYLTGRFGVRIENIITVVPDGARSLNAPAPSMLPDWSGDDLL